MKFCKLTTLLCILTLSATLTACGQVKTKEAPITPQSSIQGSRQLPPQITEARAFSNKPNIVQGNLSYKVKEYRKENKSGKTLLNFYIEAENLGANPTKINVTQKDVSLNFNNKIYTLNPNLQNSFFYEEVKPQKKVKTVLTFELENNTKGKAILNLGKGIIEVNIRV